MTDKPVTLAVIIGAHGVAGEVRLKLFGEGVESLTSYKSFEAAGGVLTLKSVRPGPNGAVARFAEIGDRSAAEALRGTELTVPRSALPPLGEIVAVENFGAGDIVEVQRPPVGDKPGKRFMAPIHVVTFGAAGAVIDAAFAA